MAGQLENGFLPLRNGIDDLADAAMAIRRVDRRSGGDLLPVLDTDHNQLLAAFQTIFCGNAAAITKGLGTGMK